ncbi:Imm21 family immunity protein [Streptomyces rubellomurinus]|uniref:Immunity protein 21 of polymorphic toxin system n=2 Tax=Streptomyces TaxID=1883 RepID=A0A0F2TIQ5_STRR3|nr:Imm21 family immunity protein [Streptomyces rubellomurinus]KJS62160.1 hypothetical protein VM95_10765 [Streptomyces rubellomurinus]
MTHTKQAWLDGTDSGWYVLCPEATAAGWTGEEADVFEGGYAAVHRVAGHGDLLVLGAEPLPVRWLAQERIFVRPVDLDLDDDLRPPVAEALRAGVWEDGPVAELTAGRYLLIDTVGGGAEAIELGEYLTVDLPPGRYRVQSLLITPDRPAPCYLERLVPLA